MLIIKNIPQVRRHAIDRFKERVCVDNTIVGNRQAKRLIQGLMTNRVLNVEMRKGEIFRVKSSYLKVYFDKRENSVLTVLPYRTLDAEEVKRLIEYYSV